MHSIEGDFLGAESCFDLRAEMEEGVGRLLGGGLKRRERVRVKREYPPPLPWLARTESLPTAQMPWVMKRSYTEDGRLIITEEKAERYQYFRVHRSDRRLRMDLVQIQVPFWNRPAAAASDETAEEDEFVSAAEMHADHTGGSDAAVGGAVVAVAAGGDDDGGSGGGNKCSGSLVFGVAAVPPLRPVRT